MKTFLRSLFLALLMVPVTFSPVAFGQGEMEAFREAAAKEQPLQRDVAIDSIAEQEIPLCELVVSEDRRQMTLLSPQRIVLRRFADTDGDPQAQVDRWSYYQNGIEVYREMDTTGDGKRDQFRWLNSAGTRWGLDTTGDGAINEWKEISAEEVSREITLALATNDARRFLAVALKENELQSLELGEALHTAITQKIAALPAGFVQAAAAVALTNDTEWYQLSAALPGRVPAGDQGNRKDLQVYENAAVTIGDGVNVRQLSIGTLVKIGDNNWRVLDLPKVYDAEQASFTFIQPVHAQGSLGPADSEIVVLMNQVLALRQQIPALPAAQRPEKHKEVVNLLLEIVRRSTTQQEREDWIREIADTIMQAVGAEEYPDGKEQIASLFNSVNRPATQELAAHVRSRQIMVDYCIALAVPGSDPMRAYTQWLADLEDMVTTFPKTEASLDGMMQLASYKEMLDPTNEESIKWYRQVIERVPGSLQAAKASGAIRRLTAEGREVPFRGFTDTAGRAFDITDYKGKFVLLCFWETRTAAQLAVIKAVTDRFEQEGLVPIGINLDFDEATLQAALQNAPSTWRHLHAPNGLEGELAIYWGIMTPPSMILYDTEGKVVRSTMSTVEELQQALTEFMP